MPFIGRQIFPILLPQHAGDKVLYLDKREGQKEVVLAGTDVKCQSRQRFEQS